MGADYRINVEDCKQILQKYFQNNNFEIIDFEEKSLKEEVMGIMAGHYKLEVKVKVNGEIITKKFFEKRMRAAFDIQNEMIKVQGAYEKEAFAYEILFPKFSILPKYDLNYVPVCYLAVKDELFIFEYLSDSDYISNKLNSFILDVDHFKTALYTTAHFHAGSIIYEETRSREIGKKYQLSDEYSQYFKDSLYRNDVTYLGYHWFQAGVRGVAALIEVSDVFSPNNAEMKEKFLEESEKMYDYVKASTKHRNVICHGDLWSNNIQFKYEGDTVVHCKLIDFQAVRYTVPANDVLSLTAYSGSKFLDQHLKDLCDYYYESLKEHLQRCDIDINKHITYEQFQESIRDTMPFIIIQKACFSTMFLFECNSDMLKDQDLFKEFMYEDRQEKCLDAYKNSPMFRNMMNDAFINLKKLLTNSL